MAAIPLLQFVCKLLECEVENIHEYLFFPFNREKVDSLLKGLWLQTTYKNRQGSKHLFCYSGLSIQDAKHLKAYKGFLGITVAQHFYVRHRIRLRQYNLPCVIEYTSHGDAHYYPLELLEVVIPFRFDKTLKEKFENKSNKHSPSFTHMINNFVKKFYFE